jgi:pyruvate dehydrogenase E2 component (dihydrolipoamide acetyltransferase)
MSRYDFKLPDIGEGVTEGEVVGWHVKVGDIVKEDQALADVMTDKATVTITCPKAGVVTAINGKPGEIIKVGAVLASFELGGGAGVATPAAPAKADGPAATAVGDIKESLPGMGVMVQTTVAKPAAPVVSVVPVVSAAPAASAAPAYSAPGKVLATPATRKLARDLGVDLTRVPPSGHRGHVTKDDIRGFVARPSAPPAAVSAPPPVVTEAPAPQAVATTPSPAPMTTMRAPVSIAAAPSRGGEALEERVPFAGVRKRIAERMSALEEHRGALHLRGGVRRGQAHEGCASACSREGRGAGREAHVPALHREGHGGGAEEVTRSLNSALDESHERARVPQLLPRRHRCLDRGRASWSRW